MGRWLSGGGCEFDEFAVGFVLDYAVYVAVSFVVPDSLGCHVHCKGVATLGEMAVGVGFIVTAAAHVSTDKADPEIGIRVTHTALVQPCLFSIASVVGGSFAKTHIVLGITAYRTT